MAEPQKKVEPEGKGYDPLTGTTDPGYPASSAYPPG